MSRLCRSLALWIGVWFFSAFAFTYLVTHRVAGRYDEPAPPIAWGTVESPRLTTRDGEELGAWFVNHNDGDEPAVILLHGVGANRCQLLGIAEEFHRRGCPVLLVTQRAHGDSTGCLNDFGCSGGPDLLAAVDWLHKRTPGRKVVVWGTSMGAATALFGAEEAGDKVAGYILECPYQNLRIATRNRTKACLPPVVESLAYHTLNVTALAVLPHIDAIAPEDAAAKLPSKIPVLILAGQHDHLALPEESHAIAARIGPNAKVVIAPNGGHTNLLRTDGELIRGEIDEFMASVRSVGQHR